MLQEEFCNNLSDLYSIPVSGGDACIIQEEAIIFECANNDTTVGVNFVLMINVIETELTNISPRLKIIMDTIGYEPKNNITFDAGEVSGNYHLISNHYTGDGGITFASLHKILSICYF